MKVNVVRFVALAVCSVLVIANGALNCPIDTKEYLYECKAKDEEGQDLSCTCLEQEHNNTSSYNCTCFPYATPPLEEHYLDCFDAMTKGQTESGIYLLKPDKLSPFKAYCDMDTDGGGWSVFQRRLNGSVNFYRNWINYVRGFGNVSGEHWLGLSKIHRLTNGSVSTHLRIDLRDKSKASKYATYSNFHIGGSATDYTLHVNGYIGTAGDSLRYHNLRKFSTKDNDNDPSSYSHCAVSSTGAWWYNSCHYSNLNGVYGDNTAGKGIIWRTWKGNSYSLAFAEMKLRRAKY